MAVRAHSKHRCDRCRMTGPFCLCGVVRARPTRTRVVIVMHAAEQPLSTNTARLSEMALENCEIRLRGLLGQPLRTDDLADASDRQPLLLFPSEDARVLDAEYFASLKGRPVTLIVPDGSWNQAKKVPKREPGLASVPRVKLAPGPLSNYRLRSEPTPESVCTVEAIARALGVLEGPEQGPGVRKGLEDELDRMVERILLTRHQIRPEHCRHPLPEGAIEWLRDASAWADRAEPDDLD